MPRRNPGWRDDIVKRFKVRKKFEKLGAGELVELIKRLNSDCKKVDEVRDIMMRIFNRDDVIPKYKKTLWWTFSNTLKPTRHKKRETIESDDLLNLIKKLKDFAIYIRDENIFPRVVRMTREVTESWGTKYYEAIDDGGDNWIITNVWMDPMKVYFMYSSSKNIALEPIIIPKEFE